MAGVYISYPFCNQKCSFCNFASGVYQPSSRSRYEQALLKEIVSHKWDTPPDTVYFGGGTPSLMASDLLDDIMRAIPYESLCEVTLECAPGTITGEKVSRWVQASINRVSLGVQSFNITELRATGRRHTAEEVKSDLALLRSAGINNINLDLIAGLPHQTRESWNESLDWIERLDAPHVSIYIFEIDEDSRLGQEVLLGGNRYSARTLPDEELTAELYQTAVDRLARNGWERYEISNFARPGWQSRHNLKYWQLEPYIGFGLDAHSFDGRYRWSNPDALDEYLCSDKPPLKEKVNRLEERFFVGLRLMNGITPTPEERRKFAEPISKWVNAGMLEEDGNALRLSPQSILLSNEILQDFIQL
ncbi:MAG: radical SAM family heme chaperone HemW [Acidobacteriaceae bacterium]|nr:radical SAM family heme chaperone HemW [Acidobacteriaceae bacterium]